MARLDNKRYQVQVLIAMTVYVIVLLSVWPLARTVTYAPAKWLLALAPVLPMLYVIALMARRIRDCDEMEQRTHLVALGASTAVVGALSLVGGFLATAKVVAIDGSILIWVFPVMMACYGVARWWALRQYGGSLACESDAILPEAWRMGLVAVTIVVVGVFAWFKHDAGTTGVFIGMASAFVLILAIKGLSYWRKRNDPDHGEEP